MYRVSAYIVSAREWTVRVRSRIGLHKGKFQRILMLAGSPLFVGEGSASPQPQVLRLFDFPLLEWNEVSQKKELVKGKIKTPLGGIVGRTFIYSTAYHPYQLDHNTLPYFDSELLALRRRMCFNCNTQPAHEERLVLNALARLLYGELDPHFLSSSHGGWESFYFVVV